MRFAFALFDFYESSLDWLYQGRRLSEHICIYIYMPIFFIRAHNFVIGKFAAGFCGKK